MSDIPVYKSLAEKKALFDKDEFFIIKTKSKLEKWFQFYGVDFKREHPVDFIFRGMSEAKYKLFNSAQRIWIIDNMEQWNSSFTYMDYIVNLVAKAKANQLLKKIFDLHDYRDNERDFPILSLLQHYGAPTPLIDWSYNINIAAFFAIDGIHRSFGAGDSIDNYMSVYSIHKKSLTSKQELLSLLDISGTKQYPSINDFRDFGDEGNPKANALFILSDFEPSTQLDYRGELKVRTEKPITSLFNQNIIPQEGLLMYNPFKDRPVEQLFNVDQNGEGQNLHLEPFKCFNIHKDLSEYLRRLIINRHGIKKSFIYPHLYDDAKSIKEEVLNDIAK